MFHAEILVSTKETISLLNTFMPVAQEQTFKFLSV